MIALLGKRDEPTDGVEDYCKSLRRAIAAPGCELDLVRVLWAREGWTRSLRRLRHRVEGEQGHWILAQYTALNWSRRGFPGLFLVLLWMLRVRKMRIAIVFHDSAPYHGTRLVDRLRSVCQRWVMRSAYHLADKSVMNVPLEQISWLPQDRSKAAFIPIGSNIPPVTRAHCCSRNGHLHRTIAIFGITGDGAAGDEIADIAFVARTAAERVRGIRLITLGRGSIEAEARLRQALDDAKVKFSSLGILPAEQVAEVLSHSDLSLFVRGPISTQRGSAIASIACGLPLVAYSDSMPAPFAEAGVVGVRCGDRDALAEASIKVLTDPQLWLDLRRRNQQAYEKYFSWNTIADRFVELLSHA